MSCCVSPLSRGRAPSSGPGAGTVVVLDRVEEDAPFFNSNAEQTIYTFDVPAGRVATLGQTLRLCLRGDMLVATAGAPTVILRVRWGGLLWYQDTMTGRTNIPVAIPWRLDVEIGRMSAALFYGSAHYHGGAGAIGATTVGGGDLAGAGGLLSPSLPLDSLGERACDFTIAQTLAVSIQFSAADPNIGTTVRSGTLVLE